MKALLWYAEMMFCCAVPPCFGTRLLWCMHAWVVCVRVCVEGGNTKL